jgi:hypothetical protein|tara:strand:- start:561 stop:2603 length:2043 start_codon:yes stop_codon:yes gene_type:complete
MSKFFLTNLSAYTAPEVVELKNKDWVQYGVDNNYFNYIIHVNNNSTTNRAICIGVSNMIYGKGLAAHNADKKPEQYAQMMSLFKKQDLRRFINDYKILGMSAFQIIYEGERVKEVHHFPMETLRAEKCNEKTGEIEAWYYSNHWENLKPNEIPERIPAFRFGKKGEAEMYVLRPYEAGKYYYSSPDWSSAMPYAVLEDEISDYLINDCINGFSGTKVVNFNNGVPDPDKMQSIKSEILNKLTGSRGEKVIVAFNNNAESKTTIDDIPLNDAPRHYEYLADECFKKLIVGHRVTSPMLLGIREGSDGLGNNAEEIKNATQLFDNIVIQCFQDQVIECIDSILSVNDIALDLYFKTLKPLDFTDIDIVNKEIIEEETGYEMSSAKLKMIDGVEAYKTKEEAIAKAIEQDCGGYHEHEIEGVIYYMPCENHDISTDLKAPCWDGYEQIGTKMKNGKKVPNCVPLAKELNKDLQDFINLGEDIDEDIWEAIDEQDVNYEFDNQIDEIITELNNQSKEELSTLGKIWKFVSTGIARPNSKSAQDKEVKVNGVENYFKVRYKYYPASTKDNPRDFCVAMTKAKKLYRKEDIIAMGKKPVNKGWGPKGDSATYSIWLYKGGGNCHHSWRRVTYRSKEAKIDLKTSQDIIGTRQAAILGYKVTNPYQVSVQPRNLPNKGFLPGNPQGK